MRILAATAALVAAMVYTGSASATTDPAATATVRCLNGQAVATFTYSGFSPSNQLTATETLIGAAHATARWQFNGPSSSHTLTAAFDPPNIGRPFFAVVARTVVVGGGGRRKAEAMASTTCQPPPPPPPPPARVDPRAHFWGPCGDPFYRAVLDNRRSSRAVKFAISYQPFGDPRRTLTRWVGPRKKITTGLFDVAGTTRMSIRWVRPGPDKVLDSQLSAPNRVYASCPTGVAVIH